MPEDIAIFMCHAYFLLCSLQLEFANSTKKEYSLTLFHYILIIYMEIKLLSLNIRGLNKATK